MYSTRCLLLATSKLSILYYTLSYIALIYSFTTACWVCFCNPQLFSLLVQADGQELLRACTREQWDVAEDLILSESTLEAQDKVVVHVCL